MKLQRRQRVLLVLAILALTVIASATVHHQRMKRALADYQNQLIASGEKLTVEEMTPKPVPIEQNGASAFLRALTLMNVQQDILTTNPPPSMTMVAPGKARIGSLQPNIRSREATNSWEDAIVIVDNLAPALAMLEELIERPNLDLGVNYRLGFTAPLPNLAQTKRAATMLCCAIICDLHREDTESATRRVRALIAILQGSADERLVISQLVRIAVVSMASVVTWELLQSPNVTDEQLAQVQNDWARLEFTLAAENALAIERAMGLMTAEQMRESSAEFRKMTTAFVWPGTAPAASGGSWFDQAEKFAKDTWDKTRLKAKETAWRFSWVYTDQLRTLKGLQVIIESVRLARTNGNFHAAHQELETKLNALGLYDNRDEPFPDFGADVDIRTMFSQGILSLSPFLKKVMLVEANRQLVVTAIALQRYKLANGNYPADLTALVPKFLSAPPRDPVDGKTLRYKPDSDGTFLLYSVGEDGEDSGGDPKPANKAKSFGWQRGRDWVWPQPATQQEVEDYYRREFK